MRISGSTALVTGAARGLGREFVVQLHERGAQTVYASSRRTPSFDLPQVVSIELDVTDQEQVSEVANKLPAVDLLVNNAGLSTMSALVGGDLSQIRREFDTHFWGTLAMIRAFAPVLAANGGGAVLNVLSEMCWRTNEVNAAYGAAKAAGWSLTDAVRLELAGQQTLVSGLFAGAIDTDMIAEFDVPKAKPAAVVSAALDGIEAGHYEIMFDRSARDAKASVTSDPDRRYPQLSGPHAVTRSAPFEPVTLADRPLTFDDMDGS